jgi:hypothetical protein
VDFDPRDYDSRDDERLGSRGKGGSHDDAARDDDLSQLEFCSRDRDDDGRTLGRGPGSDSRRSDSAGDARSHDPRWLERDREARDRDADVRDVFTRDVNLPRGLEREIVLHRDREYTLRGSETRTLASVGAFRVVSSRDLVDNRNRTCDPRTGDLRQECAGRATRHGATRSQARESRQRGQSSCTFSSKSRTPLNRPRRSPNGSLNSVRFWTNAFGG